MILSAIRFPTQINFFGDSSFNHALTAVAQKVTGLLLQAYPFQADGINHTLTFLDSGSRARIQANHYGKQIIFSSLRPKLFGEMRR
jgi:hypothetical protein